MQKPIGTYGMKTAIKWILGVVFVFTGIQWITIDSSIASGATAIAMGLFFIPPLLRFVEVHLRVTIPAVAKYVVAFLCVLAFGQLAKERSIAHTEDPETQEPVTVPQVRTTVIPGLEPVNVYLNLENQGFETTKRFSSAGNSWLSRMTDGEIEYVVSTLNDGSDATTVEYVTATALVLDDRLHNISDTKPFFKYVGSVPFDRNDPATVSKWLDENFNKDGSVLIVSGVEFRLTVRKNNRLLTIQMPD